VYESFYGLKEKPFELRPDPNYLYMSAGHDRVCSHLQYAVEEHKGFVVVTGEVGSGKTILVNYLLRRLPQDAVVAVVSNTALPPVQFLRMVCLEFGLSAAGRNKFATLDFLRRHLHEQFRAGRRVILVVDEAQNLPVQTIEEIRMLSNLQIGAQGLLQILLVGQPELQVKLRRKDLEQFLQRVSVHCHLGRLDLQETVRYVQHRLKVAGRGGEPLFTEEALKILYRYSEGTPRVVNMVCDTALVYGFAEQRLRIDADLLSAVVAGGFARELPLSAEPGGPVPEPSIEDAAESLAELTESVRGLAQRVRRLEHASVSMGEALETVRRDGASTIQLLCSLQQRIFARDRQGAAASPPKAPVGTSKETAARPGLRRIFGGKG